MSSSSLAPRVGAVSFSSPSVKAVGSPDVCQSVWKGLGVTCVAEGLRSLLEAVTSSNSEGRGRTEKTAPPRLQSFPGSGSPGFKRDQFAAIWGNGGLGPCGDKPLTLLRPPDPG